MSSPRNDSRRAALLDKLNAKPSAKSPRTASPDTSSQAQPSRQDALRQVYKQVNRCSRACCTESVVYAQFDLDGSGNIESSELLALGQARRKLGQKTSAWTEEKNAKLVQKMDSDGDGQVSEREFATYFDSSLPSDRGAFDEIVFQFLEVARECRARKLAKKKAEAGSPRGERSPRSASKPAEKSPRSQSRSNTTGRVSVVSASSSGVLSLLCGCSLHLLPPPAPGDPTRCPD